MQFVLPTPSLQHIAGVKIVAHLWNQRDTRDHALQMENVMSKTSTLPLPEPIKKQLIDMAEPLGMEDLAWCRYHNLYGSPFEFSDIVLPHQLCWTMHGTVDYKTTAELIVKDERLDIKKRYEFACINCLEGDAAALFASMGARRRREFVSQMRKNMITLHHQHLIAFFTFTLTGEALRMNSFFPSTRPRGTSINTVLFDGALKYGDAATCEYWFEKLSQREKERVIKENTLRMRAGRWSGASSFLYYLSLLNEEQRGCLFGECTADLLVCFLRWPMQFLFVEAAQRGWQLMDEEDCARVLDNIISKIENGFRNYYQLFWECWRLSPADVKDYFFNNISRMERLLAIEEEQFRQSVGFELVDESDISDAESMESTETDALNSWNDEEGEWMVGYELMDESDISEAESMESTETDALNSWNDEEGEWMEVFG